MGTKGGGEMKLPRFILLVWFYEKILKLRIINACYRWYYRRKVKRGMYVLKSLDGMMDKAGYHRHERRQFWREFTAKQAAREKLFERMKT
jgi:hypothetical protein